MANTGFWDDGFQITKDRLNGGLQQRDLLANIPAASQLGKIFEATDVGTLYRDNGVTWDFLRGLPRYIKKAANETVTSSTTLQNDDDFVMSVEANAEYIIEMQLPCFISNAPNIKLDWSVPSGATGEHVWWLYRGGAPGGLDEFGSGSIGSAVILDSGGNADWIVGFTRVLIDATAGNIQLQWAQNTSDVAITELSVDGIMKATRIN
jgi:hypothetical protein